MSEVKELFNLKTWDGFSTVPKEGLNYLLDITKINKRLADRKDFPYRWRTGSFHVARNCEGESLAKAIKEAISKWAGVFEKQGWVMASKVQVYGSFPARDLYSNIIQLDKKEMRMRAIFKVDPKLNKPMRIEIPTTSTKGQAVSLAQVAKGEGIKPVPLKKRPIK